jgi:hypothetical protein
MHIWLYKLVLVCRPIFHAHCIKLQGGPARARWKMWKQLSPCLSSPHFTFSFFNWCLHGWISSFVLGNIDWFAPHQFHTLSSPTLCTLGRIVDLLFSIAVEKVYLLISSSSSDRFFPIILAARQSTCESTFMTLFGFFFYPRARRALRV